MVPKALRYISFALFSTACAAQPDVDAANTICNYTTSGPITVTADNQQINNLEIWAVNQPGIDTNGFSGTSIFNVIIHHQGGSGVYISGGNGTQINATNIVGGPAHSGGINIECLNSTNLHVNNVRIANGQLGIKLSNCNYAALTSLEGHNQWGPLPNGAFVQWINSTGGSINNFYNKNVDDPALAGAEGDVVNVYHSSNVTIDNGLIDGTFATFSSGIQVDEDSSNVFVTNVDVIHSLNSAFAAYGTGGGTAIFKHVRARDTVCNSTQGTPSATNSLAFVGPCAAGYCPLGSNGGAGKPKKNVQFNDAIWYNVCTLPGSVPVPSYNLSAKSTVSNKDFSPRKPFTANVCGPRG